MKQFIIKKAGIMRPWLCVGWDTQCILIDRVFKALSGVCAEENFRYHLYINNEK